MQRFFLLLIVTLFAFLAMPHDANAACIPTQPGQLCAGYNCGLFNGTTQCCAVSSECPVGSPNYSASGPGNSASSEVTDGGAVKCKVNEIASAIGCIPYGNINQTSTFFFGWAIGIGGGITLLFIIYSGYIIITSTGDPKRLQAGQEMLTSAIGGILVIIFAIFILRFIGVNIIGIL